MSAALLILLFTPAAADQTPSVADSPPAEVNPDQDVSSKEISPSADPADPKARQKRELRLMLTLAITVISALFFVVLIISIVRMGRHLRRRLKLHKKNYPTEYVDAWSQYRLKESDQDDKEV